MKKLLLASTALVMAAGMAVAPEKAAAQGVSLSGDARMGVDYLEGRATEWLFTSRARVTFTLSGQTDTGLSFGASFRADNAGGAVGNNNMNAGNVFVSGAFGRIRMGDVDGAAQALVGDVNATSLTGLGDLNEFVYISRNVDNDTSMLYDYSMAGFTVALSAEQLGNNDLLGVAASYTFEGFTVAAGYENSDIGDHLAVGAGANFAGFDVKAVYARANNTLQGNLGTAKRDQYGLSIGGSFDAVSGNVFARRTFDNVTVYGIGASYDLGGGASVVGGLAGGNRGTATRADLGIAMSF